MLSQTRSGAHLLEQVTGRATFASHVVDGDLRLFAETLAHDDWAALRSRLIDELADSERLLRKLPGNRRAGEELIRSSEKWGFWDNAFLDLLATQKFRIRSSELPATLPRIDLTQFVDESQAIGTELDEMRRLARGEHLSHPTLVAHPGRAIVQEAREDFFGFLKSVNQCVQTMPKDVKKQKDVQWVWDSLKTSFGTTMGGYMLGAGVAYVRAGQLPPDLLAAMVAGMRNYSIDQIQDLMFIPYGTTQLLQEGTFMVRWARVALYYRPMRSTIDTLIWYVAPWTNSPAPYMDKAEAAAARFSYSIKFNETLSWLPVFNYYMLNGLSCQFPNFWPVKHSGKYRMLVSGLTSFGFYPLREYSMEKAEAAVLEKRLAEGMEPLQPGVSQGEPDPLRRIKEDAAKKDKSVFEKDREVLRYLPESIIDAIHSW